MNERELAAYLLVVLPLLLGVIVRILEEAGL